MPLVRLSGLDSCRDTIPRSQCFPPLTVLSLPLSALSAASCKAVEADAQRCCQDAGERMEAGLLHHVVVLQHLSALFNLLPLLPRPALRLLQ